MPLPKKEEQEKKKRNEGTFITPKNRRLFLDQRHAIKTILGSYDR